MKELRDMKINIKESNLLKNTLLILSLTLSLVSIYFWRPNWVADERFLLKVLVVSGVLLVSSVIYLAFTHEDKSKTATPWSSAIGVMTSLLFGIFLMFGVISALGQSVGLEVNKVFVLSLFATSIYILAEKVFFRTEKDNSPLPAPHSAGIKKQSSPLPARRSLGEGGIRGARGVIMLSLFIVTVAGDASYKWHALVLLVGLASNAIVGNYIANSTSLCLQRLGKLFERKKVGKKEKKGKRKGRRRKK